MFKKQIHQTTRSEGAWNGGRRIVVEFRTTGDAVPAVLLLPPVATPAPAALLLHGYTSRKEHMAEGVGAALLERGIGSLSIDLPLHGTRSDPLQAQAYRNPMALLRVWRQAVAECSLALRYLAARREVDAERLAVAGYSLGSFLATLVAAQDKSVRALVLAAGGDLPSNTPMAAVARGVADPVRSIRKLNGRPLLMVHGRADRTMTPDQAERLFAAAGEPKELRWWNAGHILPPEAIRYAAGWLAERLDAG
ncbi:MAG TPA: alpha/beta fold hydrolase [Longimicrobium sp.]|nr:alpha/beta fold hydrolase [Longimicrobium sp.]